MTNDILEQVVEDYFRSQGYFTMHNISYRPVDFKQTPSDIDVMAVHPTRKGKNRVVVISCKSWQEGLNIPRVLKDLIAHPDKVIQGKSREKIFREIAMKEWSDALIETVFKYTGQKTFTFYIAATHIKGEYTAWNNFPLFKSNLSGCDIKLIELKEMIANISSGITTTPHHSELGRLLQLIKASGLQIT